MKRKNEILDLSFDFTLQILAYSETLKTNKRYAISQQLLKSGISIGTNIREAQNAESNQDFIHKLKIADKETKYWLQLCYQSSNYSPLKNLDISLICIKKNIWTQ